MEQSRRGWSRRSIGLLMGSVLLGLLLWWRIAIALGVMVLFAALFAALLSPMATRLEQRMLPGAAAGLSILLLVATVLLFLGIVLPSLLTQARVLIEQLPRLLAELDLWISQLNEQLAQTGLPELSGPTAAMALWDASAFLQGVLDSVGGVAGRLTQWILVPVIGFYFLRDRAAISYQLTLLIPIQYRRKTLWVASETRRALMGYVRGQLLVTLATGALTALALLCLRVPGWLAFGGWMALCNMIPYFGPLLGAIPIVLFGASMGWQRMAWALAAILAIQQIEGNYLSPRVIGDQTGLHPVTVLLALAVGNMVFGLWGILLSLPVLVAARAVIRGFQSAAY